jgi:hypothetical protein
MGGMKMSPELIADFMKKQMAVNFKMTQTIEALNQNYSKMLQMIQEINDKLNQHISEKSS